MKPTVEYIQALVDQWLPRLGLSHWTVVVQPGEPEIEGAILEVNRHEHAFRAYITVAQWLLDGESGHTMDEITPEFVQLMAIHELCHLHFRDMRFVAQDFIESAAGNETIEALGRAMDRAEEQAVELLSVALHKSWPV